MNEVYISVDIETNGPIPGEYSMISLGAASFSADGRLFGTFSVNIEPLPGAKQHPSTMAWWASQPEAWAVATADPRSPSVAMALFREWVKGVTPAGHKSVFVGYPTGFDFTFVYWYLIKFGDRSPFSFSAIDMKTFAMALLGTSFRETSKRRMPQHWFGPEKHTHIAVDDAVEQGRIFVKMMDDWKAKKRP